MTATITINFGGGTATASSVEVLLQNCTVNVNAQAGVSLTMASAVTNVTVLQGQIAIATAYGALFNGSLSLAIGWQSGQQPQVTLNNLQNSQGSPATVIWPTASGPAAQILSPGSPMTLSNIVSD